MRKIRLLSLALLVFTSPVFLNNCNDNKIEPSSNIILYNKSLDVIKVNVQGKWDLVKIHGGICSTCPVKIIKNPYMIITGDHIVAGNDSLGVTLNTVIVWKKDKDVFGDYTYLLTYVDSRNYSYPYNAIVDRIVNDTLTIIDNASDPYFYYYLKNEKP